MQKSLQQTNSTYFLEQLKNVILMQFGRILATNILCQSTRNEDKKSDNEEIQNKLVLFTHSTTYLQPPTWTMYIATQQAYAPR